MSYEVSFRNASGNPRAISDNVAYPGPWPIRGDSFAPSEEALYNSTCAGQVIQIFITGIGEEFPEGSILVCMGQQHVVTSFDRVGGNLFIQFSSVWPVWGSWTMVSLSFYEAPEFPVTWELNDGEAPEDAITANIANGQTFEDGSTVDVTFQAPPGIEFTKTRVGDESPATRGDDYELEGFPTQTLHDTFVIHEDTEYHLKVRIKVAHAQLFMVDWKNSMFGSATYHEISETGQYPYEIPDVKAQFFTGAKLVSVNNRFFLPGTYSIMDTGGVVHGVVVIEEVRSGISIPFTIPYVALGNPQVILGFEVAESVDYGDLEDPFDAEDPGFRPRPEKPVPGAGVSDGELFMGLSCQYVGDVIDVRMKDLINAVDEVGSIIETGGEDVVEVLEAIRDNLGEIRDLLPVEVVVENPHGVAVSTSSETDFFPIHISDKE